MHRLSILLSVLVVALALPGLPPAVPRRAVAQEATPPPGTLPVALAAWVAAWEARPPDAARIAAAYTEDAVFEEVALGSAYTGRPEIQAYLTGFFAAFTGGEADFATVFAAGDRAAATWAWSGRYTGQLPGLPPPAGQPIAFRGASILELRDGMIARETQYFDVYGLLAQLGVVPGPATPGGGTPAP